MDTGRSPADFSDLERDAVYRAIAERRDVRAHFVADAVPDDVLLRILGAAHQAPSVGLSQPWRFIVTRSAATRAAVHDAFAAAQRDASAAYDRDRAAAYGRLKLEGIREAPVGICVASAENPDRGSGLGRRTMPETATYSTVCAIENLWLAARVEGLGVGWVSILDPQALRRIFAVPASHRIVAYLCVGYVSGFAAEPDLVRAGWEERAPLSGVVDYEEFAPRTAQRVRDS